MEVPSRVITICLIIVFAMASSSSSAGHSEVAAQEPSTSVRADANADKLKPTEFLKRSCDVPVSSEFKAAGIEKGGMGVDFTLLDTEGRKVSLSGLLQFKPVVLILGLYT